MPRVGSVARRPRRKAVGVAPFFQDSFAGGVKNPANGFSWDSGVPVVSFSGRNAMQFRYPGVALGSDGSAEQRFNMGRQLNELWLEYQLHIPANFAHRSDPPDNNKFLSLWPENYSTTGETYVVTEFERDGVDTSYARILGLGDRFYADGTLIRDGDAVQNSNFISATRADQWHRIRVHYRIASGVGQTDGIYEGYINDELMWRSRTDWQFWSTGGLNYIQRGYFMGWANSGYTAQTDFHISDVKFYDTNPGWVGVTGGGSGVTWELLRDFNSGAVNTGVQGQPDGMDDVAGDSVYTTEQVYEGARSMKCTITAGSDGFGNWGGSINFPSNFERYDTLWCEVYAFFPTGYNITTTPGHLKFLRFRTNQANGSNRGYNDLYIQDDAVVGQRFKFIREGHDVWYYGGGTGQMVRNVWHRFTVKVVFDTVAKASGGQSQVRVWQNGALIISSDTILTLGGTTDYSNLFYLHTYWNNGNAPTTQSSYYDMLRLAKNGVPAWAADLPGV